MEIKILLFLVKTLSADLILSIQKKIVIKTITNKKTSYSIIKKVRYFSNKLANLLD